MASRRTKIILCGSACAGGKDHEAHNWGHTWYCPGWPMTEELRKKVVGIDGCSRPCHTAILAGGDHTRRWGDCIHGVPPEPKVSMSKVYMDTDGYPSIGFDSYTEQELADLIEPAMRGLKIHTDLWDFEYRNLARAAAHAIIHRNDEDRDGQAEPC